MGALLQDIRYGFRMLARNPGFTIIVVLILALGIGANTVIFSVINAVLFCRLPYKDADQLVRLCQTKTDEKGRTSISYPNFIDCTDQSQVFERCAAYYGAEWCRVATGDSSERVSAVYITGEFFSTLGVKPLFGRTFLPEEHQPGGGRVVVLDHEYWQTRFSADPNVIGQTLMIDDHVYTVVGVMEPNFRFELVRRSHLWMPLSCLSGGFDTTDRGHRYLAVIARMKPGIDMARAQGDMNVIAARLEQAYPATNTGVGLLVVSLNDVFRRLAAYYWNKEIFLILQAVVGFVLLMACINVANLLLARASTRQKEIAIRGAVGARPIRLVRQLLTENVVLAGVGGLLGLLLVVWGVDLISSLKPQYIPEFVDIHIDGRVLSFALSISLLTGMLFGLAPALVSSKANLVEWLKEGGRTSSGGFRSRGLRDLLVTSEIALAFVLLIGAGLMINSYVRIVNIDPAFNRQNVLATRIDLDYQRPPYSQPGPRLGFFQEVLERMKTLPGAQVVAAANDSPVGGTGNHNPFKIGGFSPGDYNAKLGFSEDNLPDKDHIFIRCWEIFPDYFRLLEIPLLKGRYFTDHDNETSSPVVIINESMARCFWPDENPMGKYITHSGKTVREIVGVVRDVKYIARGEPGDPEVYIPYLQTGYVWDMTFLLRTDSDPRRMVAAVKREVSAVDRNASIYYIGSLEDEMSDSISPQRLNIFFLGVPALTALILALMGIYGLVSFSVSQRTHEIGIRMTLGAKASDVLKMVMRQGLKPALIGVGVGLAGAFVLTRVISSMLYEVSATDPATFVGVSLLLTAVALSATYVPARRATKVDPMVALRYE